MADPFLGEMKIIAYTFAPRDWALCYGGEIEIRQNPGLYSLIGCQFGGDNQSYFKLPDMRGRIPVSPYQMYTQGDFAGAETVTLSEHNLPQHSHQIKASTDVADTKIATNADDMFAVPQSPIYNTATNLTQLHSTAFTETGGSDAHSNIQPSLVLKFIIALQGQYPPRP